MRLKQRVEKVEEAVLPNPDSQRFMEIHRVIMKDAQTPMLNDDGTPMIIVRKVKS